MPALPNVRRRATRLVAVGAMTLALAIAVAACGLAPLGSQAAPVAGSGDTVTENRTTDVFSHVSVAIGARVVIRMASQTGVTLEAQANLQPLIKTTITDGQLVVSADAPGIAGTEPIVLTISTPTLSSVSLSAGAVGTLEAEGRPIAIDVSAGASIIAIGSIEALEITASTGATANLEEFAATSAKVKLTGSGVVTINVSGNVTGEADAGSTLVLIGKPASVDVTTSGGATVQGG